MLYMFVFGLLMMIYTMFSIRRSFASSTVTLQGFMLDTSLFFLGIALMYISAILSVKST